MFEKLKERFELAGIGMGLLLSPLLFIGERHRQEQISQAAKELGPNPTQAEIESKAKDFEKFGVSPADIERRRGEMDEPKQKDIIGTGVLRTVVPTGKLTLKGKPIFRAATPAERTAETTKRIEAARPKPMPAPKARIEPSTRLSLFEESAEFPFGRAAMRAPVSEIKAGIAARKISPILLIPPRPTTPIRVTQPRPLDIAYLKPAPFLDVRAAKAPSLLKKLKFKEFRDPGFGVVTVPVFFGVGVAKGVVAPFRPSTYVNLLETVLHPVKAGTAIGKELSTSPGAFIGETVGFAKGFGFTTKVVIAKATDVLPVKKKFITRHPTGDITAVKTLEKGKIKTTFKVGVIEKEIIARKAPKLRVKALDVTFKELAAERAPTLRTITRTGTGKIIFGKPIKKLTTTKIGKITFKVTDIKGEVIRRPLELTVKGVKPITDKLVAPKLKAEPIRAVFEPTLIKEFAKTITKKVKGTLGLELEAKPQITETILGKKFKVQTDPVFRQITKKVKIFVEPHFRTKVVKKGAILFEEKIPAPKATGELVSQTFITQVPAKYTKKVGLTFKEGAIKKLDLRVRPREPTPTVTAGHVLKAGKQFTFEKLIPEKVVKFKFIDVPTKIPKIRQLAIQRVLTKPVPKPPALISPIAVTRAKLPSVALIQPVKFPAPITKIEPITKAVFREAIKPKPLFKVKPISDIRPVSKIEPIIKVRPIAKVSPISKAKPFQEIKPIIDVKPVQKVRPIQEIKPIQDIRAIQKIAPIQEIKPIETETVFKTRPIPKLPEFPLASMIKKKKKKLKVVRPLAFNPSLGAVFDMKVGKRPKVLTGIEERLIPKARLAERLLKQMKF